MTRHAPRSPTPLRSQTRQQHLENRPPTPSQETVCQSQPTTTPRGHPEARPQRGAQRPDPLRRVEPGPAGPVSATGGIAACLDPVLPAHGALCWIRSPKQPGGHRPVPGPEGTRRRRAGGSLDVCGDVQTKPLPGPGSKPQGRPVAATLGPHGSPGVRGRRAAKAAEPPNQPPPVHSTTCFPCHYVLPLSHQKTHSKVILFSAKKSLGHSFPASYLVSLLPKLNVGTRRLLIFFISQKVAVCPA